MRRAAAYTERLAGWQLKAMREAKLATDWTAPNLEYEDAARSFLYTIMADPDGFLPQAAQFADRIGPAGAVNGLAQTLLKLTVPGVPDFFQGTEFWDLSLVDPDNRAAVDFERRVEALAAGKPAALAAHWRDGRVKQAVIQRALAPRGRQPELFAAWRLSTARSRGPIGGKRRGVPALARRSALPSSAPRMPVRLLAAATRSSSA